MMLKSHLLMGKTFLMEQKEVYDKIIDRLGEIYWQFVSGKDGDRNRLQGTAQIISVLVVNI